MNKTKIEWVKNPDGTPGYTWNPITGCNNHINGLCKGGNFPCYAYRLAHGRLKDRYLANQNVAICGFDMVYIDGKDPKFVDPFYPRFWSERIPTAFDHWYKQKPRGIFVCDMGELFGDWIPERWQEYVFDVIKSCPQHRFYLLTKQPQNLLPFSPFPPNCWVGVTATNSEQLYEAIQHLSCIQATIRFLSFEPLLGRMPLVLDTFLSGWCHWLIIGAQTKPYKPPKIEWVEEIWRAGAKVGIPVFMKDNLKPLLPYIPPFYNSTEFYQARVWKLRQELPK